MALLVVAMLGTSKVAQASGVSISISGVQSVSASCATGHISVNFTLSVSVATGSTLTLNRSVTAPGAPNPLNGPSHAFSGGSGPNNNMFSGPYSNSVTMTPFATTIGGIAPNTIITITYYNAGSGGGSSSIQINCSTGAVVGGSGAFNITHFDPADGRIDGQPGDRLVIYCNPAAKPPSIDIYGITDDGLGFLLGRFKFSLVVRAGKNGVVLRPVGKGKIYLQVDANNNFYAAWVGGPYNATGLGIFAKSFACPFKR